MECLCVCVCGGGANFFLDSRSPFRMKTKPFWQSYLPWKWNYTACSTILRQVERCLVGYLNTIGHLRRTDILSGEVTVKTDMSRSEKGSTLEGKNLLPLGANSFLLEQMPFRSKFFPFSVDPFSADWQACNKHEVTKIVSLEGNPSVFTMPLTQVVSRESLTV